MIKAEIIRKGDIKVRLEVELTVDQLKDLADACRSSGYKGDVFTYILMSANRISQDVEKIFRGVPDEQ